MSTDPDLSAVISAALAQAGVHGGTQVVNLLTPFVARRVAEEELLAGGNGKQAVLSVPWVVTPDDQRVVDSLFNFRLRQTTCPEPGTDRLKAVAAAGWKQLTKCDGSWAESVVVFSNDILGPAVVGLPDVHTCLSRTDPVLAAQQRADFALVKRLAIMSTVDRQDDEKKTTTGAGVAGQAKGEEKFGFEQKKTRRVIGMTRQYAQMKFSDNAFFCTNPLECRKKASTVHVNHLKVSIPIQQVAYGMRQHGAYRALGIIFFVTEMLTRDTGYIPDLDANWVVDRNRDVISVIPRGGCGDNWSMPHKAWLKIVTTSSITVEKEVYVWELFSKHGPILIYRMTRMKEKPMGDTILHIKHDRTDQTPHVRIKFWDLRTKVIGAHNAYAWDEKEVVWPLTLVKAVESKAMALPAKKYTVQELFRTLRDHTTTVVNDGASVRESKHRLSVEQVTDGVKAIYLMQYRARFEQSKTVTEMVNVLRTHSAMRHEDLVPLACALVVSKVKKLSVALVNAILPRLGKFDPTPIAEPLPEFLSYVQKVPAGGLKEERSYTWYSYSNSDYPSPFKPEGPEKYMADMPGFLNKFETYMKKKSVVERVVPEETSSRRDPPDSGGGAGDSNGVDAHLVADEDSAKPDPVYLSEEKQSLVDAMMTKHDLMDYELNRPPDLKLDDKLVPELLPSDATPISVADPLGDMQDAIDKIYPDNRVRVAGAEVEVFHTTEQSVFMTGMNNRMNVSLFSMPKPDSIVRSKLITPARPSMGLSTQATVAAWEKRNNDVPERSGYSGPEDTARDVFDYVYRSGLMSADADALLASYKANPIIPSKELLSRWVARADGAKVGFIAACAEDFASDAILNKHPLMIKRDPKTSLIPGEHDSLIKPQTVVYHKADLTAAFSPIFVEAATRFLRLFGPKVIIQLNKDRTGMETDMQKAYALRDRTKKVHHYEGDLGKFDKSQHMEAAALEKEVFLQLGLPPDFVEMWMDACRYATVSAGELGFSAEVQYQRRSGTATTTLGNTIVNLFSFIRAFEVTAKDVIYLAALGDDSLLASHRDDIPQAYAQTYLQDVFGFSVKCVRSPVGYICSQYVVPVCGPGGDETLVLMTDPVKRMFSLSRGFLCADSRKFLEEVENRWKSFADIMTHYDVAAYREALATVIVVRSGFPYILSAIEALVTVAKDKEKFISLYNSELESRNI